MERRTDMIENEMIPEVSARLNEMANDKENFYQFIRDTEQNMNIAPKRLELLNLEELNDYIEFLDDLWNK
jgi:hypothetical protein